jgi:hypothetical protein
MTIPRRLLARISDGLAIAALLVFACLAQRHVGGSFFLADQIDQLQSFEAALRLDPEGLWGPPMSGTSARALGPFGAFVFGMPVALGLGIDAIHALTSLLLAIAAGAAFFQLSRIDRVLAWVWLLVFTAMRITWWNAGMFWVNTLLLPLGLLLMALAAACLLRPTMAKLLALALFLLLALQVHLTALVAAPPLLLIALAGRGRITRSSRTTTVAAIAIGLALLPYAMAEARTGFRNTRAMFSHIDSAVHTEADAGRDAAIETLAIAADPMELLSGRSRTAALAAGAAIAALALIAVYWGAPRFDSAAGERTRPSPALWLVAAAVLGILAQALFFRLMARPLNGLHYVTLLSPFYALIPAALIAAIVPTRGRTGRHEAVAAALGAAAVVLLIVRGPTVADGYVEHTDWTFRATVRALDALCGGGAADTAEGPGLIDEMHPQYDSVLRYVMKRGFTRCRYDPSSELLIVANREREFPESRLHGDAVYQRETVLPPGIARYRRVR